MSFNFWRRWLLLVTGGVLVYSLCLMLLPDIMHQFFTLLFFPSMDIAQFSDDARRYIAFAHGILGAVIIGWMTTIMAIVVGSFRPGQRAAWKTLALSIALWFMIDSGYSLLTGVAAHALFNVGFLLLFAVPLAATYHRCHEQPYAVGTK